MPLLSQVRVILGNPINFMLDGFADNPGYEHSPPRGAPHYALDETRSIGISSHAVGPPLEVHLGSGDIVVGVPRLSSNDPIKNIPGHERSKYLMILMIEYMCLCCQ